MQDQGGYAQLANIKGRKVLEQWQQVIHDTLIDQNFSHNINFYFAKNYSKLHQELSDYQKQVLTELDPLVIENNLALNLPRINPYDGVGTEVEEIIHHPSYIAAGDIIYGSRLLERLAKPGGLLEALCFMFIASFAGEAGHNCPMACSAGIVRVFQHTPDFPLKKYYLEKLLIPNYRDNFTGAQFLTEVQGGSDVGLNATRAFQDEKGQWRIRGEKWFCSNANAELILMTARYDESIPGTKGLGLFLVPAKLESSERNHYTFRRLKDKIGTRSMASAEINFNDAYAIPMGEPSQGFKLVMENVLHLSRLFNTFCMLGMAHRAYQIALTYAKYRVAFDHPIIDYPLVKENLAQIKAENTAMLASIFATIHMQDEFDQGKEATEKMKLLLRLLANLNKYISALWSVEHIHHCLDVLAGNGAIESFSIMPRLLRDSIVCENWEGTHNTLRMQILKDILRYNIDEIFIEHCQTKLQSIKEQTELREVIQPALISLRKQITEFKKNSAELQSLQIKLIVDQMAILFCGVSLIEEAIDQSKNGSQNKLMCLKYFIKKHLSDKPLEYNADYLHLITAIIA